MTDQERLEEAIIRVAEWNRVPHNRAQRRVTLELFPSAVHFAQEVIRLEQRLEKLRKERE